MREGFILVVMVLRPHRLRISNQDGHDGASDINDQHQQHPTPHQRPHGLREDRAQVEQMVKEQPQTEHTEDLRDGSRNAVCRSDVVHLALSYTWRCREERGITSHYDRSA